MGILIGNPALPAYGAAERAVDSITESAAVTYGAKGIRVNAIAPGLTITEMVEDWNRHDPGVIDRIVGDTPLGRAAEPREIAESAAWLLSDRASYVTGVVLPVTGDGRVSSGHGVARAEQVATPLAVRSTPCASCADRKPRPCTRRRAAGAFVSGDDRRVSR
ncbi:SDR family NAD(P)-dependent oxidoreductase [Nocardia sp. BMG51109]|uniref:SDR family NAD(P)-dependent oxidoreductase n=1 Tax=Nocardia sp. BMG51109 TaxID=1056816 RepID=UPI0004668B8A|nr:SDR family oxidoreductase [Nocardia sp. BMG51109]